MLGPLCGEFTVIATCIALALGQISRVYDLQYLDLRKETVIPVTEQSIVVHRGEMYQFRISTIVALLDRFTASPGLNTPTNYNDLRVRMRLQKGGTVWFVDSEGGIRKGSSYGKLSPSGRQWLISFMQRSYVASSKPTEVTREGRRRCDSIS